jgi:methylenetetrahydrofolate--tRNA-(uracil-5-)-methyltransferase
VPGGTALAVDREIFSQAVHDRVTGHPNITVRREEASDLPSPGVLATGPLTSARLTEAMVARLGSGALAFYDAIAPVVSDDSLDHERLYALSRYGKGGGDDYLNAPLDGAAYERFLDALLEADPKHFQPMNANFGLLEPLPGKVRKDRKKELLVERAQAEFDRFLKVLR